jgi:hypothetical protein
LRSFGQDDDFAVAGEVVGVADATEVEVVLADRLLADLDDLERSQLRDPFVQVSSERP